MQLQLNMQCIFADAANTGFAWRVEEAKLLWAQGQERVAVSISKSLLAVARLNKQANPLPYARLLSLTAKWLAQTRYSPPSIPACQAKMLGSPFICSHRELKLSAVPRVTADVHAYMCNWTASAQV